MTETELKPLSSAVLAISARCSNRRSGGTSGKLKFVTWRSSGIGTRIGGTLLPATVRSLALLFLPRHRRPAVPGPRQRRLRRPALRPRPPLRDERAVAADRWQRHDPRARDAAAVAL